MEEKKTVHAANYLAFFALVILTIFSWASAEGGVADKGNRELLVVVAMSLKFAMIYLIFMEVKVAHFFWRTIGAAYCVAIAFLFYSFLA